MKEWKSLTVGYVVVVGIWIKIRADGLHDIDTIVCSRKFTSCWSESTPLCKIRTLPSSSLSNTLLSDVAESLWLTYVTHTQAGRRSAI